MSDTETDQPGMQASHGPGELRLEMMSERHRNVLERMGVEILLFDTLPRVPQDRAHDKNTKLFKAFVDLLVKHADEPRNDYPSVDPKLVNWKYHLNTPNTEGE